MEFNFNEPQRQSSIGILVLFFDALQLYIRVFWAIFIFFILKFDEIDKGYIYLAIAAFLLGIALMAYLKYRNFTFYLDSDQEEFIISQGIFNKSKTVVQLHKIQQVNINQNLIQRVIGVYELEVDTAGSAKKEGKIKAVSQQLALALKARLLDNEINKSVSEADLQADVDSNCVNQTFMQISFVSLLKVGITSNYIRSLGLIVGFIVTVYDNAKNFITQSDFDENKMDAYLNKGLAYEFLFVIVILMVTTIFIVVLLINLIRVIVKYFDFTIARQNGSLLLSYGLLNLKNTIVKPEKVQIITITRNYFQKKMNILELKIKQATSGENQEQKAMLEIPGCNEQERDEILKLLFLKVPEKGVALKPNFRKLVFSIFLSIVVPLILFFAIGNFVVPEILEYAIVTPFYVLLVAMVVCFGFYNYRLFVNDDFIIKQSGAWDIYTEMITPNKIQAITTSQLFWHKKADIGSIKIHTAGGIIAFQLGNYSQIKQYVNRWLYQMEITDSNWM